MKYWGDIFRACMFEPTRQKVWRAQEKARRECHRKNKQLNKRLNAAWELPFKEKEWLTVSKEIRAEIVKKHECKSAVYYLAKQQGKYCVLVASAVSYGVWRKKRYQMSKKDAIEFYEACVDYHENYTIFPPKQEVRQSHPLHSS